MEHIKKFLTVTSIFVFIIACSKQPPQADLKPEEIAQTLVVQTADASLLNPTSTIPATDPPPSPIAEPTDTLPPAPTAIPEPIKISDDFSVQRGIWGECENCVWKDGALYFGPFPPKGVGQDQIFYMICEACGEHRFYRVSADVTYYEGYGGDRTFGILAGLSIGDYLGAGTVTTSQHALYETFDLVTNSWGLGTFAQFAAVKAGRGTNRVEVTIKESSFKWTADITVKVNGKTTVSLYNQEVEPTKVGLYLGWHSVGIQYDNFEFEAYEVSSK